MTKKLFFIDRLHCGAGVHRRPFPGTFAVILILGLWLDTVWARDFLELRSEQLAYTPSLPVKQFFTDWRGSLQPAGHALGYRNHETNYGHSPWRIGLYVREDFHTHYSRDTAEVYYLTKNELDLDVDKRYAFDLSVEYVHRRGVRWRRLFDLAKNINVGLSLQAIQGLRLVSGRITGFVTPLAKNDYDFENLFLDYYYFRDYVFDREVTRPAGYGYGLDLALSWHPVANSLISIRVHDLYSVIYWWQSPHTRAFIESDNKRFDEDGYVKIDPLLRGHHEERDFRQRLTQRIRFLADLPIAAGYSWRTRLYHSNGVSLFATGLRWQWRKDRHISLLHDPINRAWQGEWQGPLFGATLGTDRSAWDKARSLSLHLRLRYAWGSH